MENINYSLIYILVIIIKFDLMNSQVKLTVIMFVNLLFSLTAFSQEINLKNVVYITLPAKAVKLNHEQRASKGRAKSTLNLKLSQTEVYEIDNIIIQVNASREGPIEDNQLNDMKAGMDEMYGWDDSLKNYTSAIKTINGQGVLVIYYEKDNIGSYKFNSYSGDSAIVGNLEFASSEKRNAESILHGILKSIKFN